MTKRLFGLAALIVSLAAIVGFSLPDGETRVVFCNVGQGDATLISRGFTQVLVDGGPNEAVLECLAKNMPVLDRQIEAVFNTHPEADHLTGLGPVMDRYSVTNVFIGPEAGSGAVWQEWKSKLEKLAGSGGLVIRNVYTGDLVRIGDIELKVLWPERKWVAERMGDGANIKYQISNIKNTENNTGYVLGATTTKTAGDHLNDFSIVLELGNQVLLMGDADSRIQDEVLTANPNSIKPVKILKFPHHGSKTGITAEFLKSVAPKEAVISVGKNSYGHPTKEALNMLISQGIIIRRTDNEGEIVYKF